MQDKPPQNRAERRQQARSKGKPGASLVRPFRPQSQNTTPEAAIGTGSQSAEDDEAAQQPETVGASLPFSLPWDTPPADRKVSHKAGGSKQANIQKTLVSYYALAGLGVSRWDMVDGQLIVANAEKCADAWVAAGKANPQIMRALELVTVAGPYTALVMVHVGLVFAIMDRHGANPLGNLFAPAPARPVENGPTPAEPAPLPYQPVGANAPTDAAPPPQTYAGDESGLVIFPDEGLPAEIDIALRQLARQQGRPYEELRQEALVQIAQQRMAQNGHIQQPGALGAPVARG